jgi:hypothetical protein
MSNPCACKTPAGCSGVPFPADAVCQKPFAEILKAVEAYGAARATIAQMAAMRRDAAVQRAAFAASEQRLAEVKALLSALPVTPAAPPPPPAG